MSSPLCLPVEEQQNGERIDKFLQESIPGMSRSQAQKWIAQGFVKIGEEQAGKNDKLKSGMSVFVILPELAEDADGEIDWEAATTLIKISPALTIYLAILSCVSSSTNSISGFNSKYLLLPKSLILI